MSTMSVRQIVLTSLTLNVSVEGIVAEIREQRPDSQAGVPEVKWYISKMKKEGFLDKNAAITEKGQDYVNSIQFKSSKTHKPVGTSALRTTLKKARSIKEGSTKLQQFMDRLAGKNAKQQETELKAICKELGINFYKRIDGKEEKKAIKFERIKVAFIG